MLYVILDSAMKVLPKRYVPVHDKDNYVRILSRLFPDSQTVLQIDIHSLPNSFERHSIFFKRGKVGGSDINPSLFSTLLKLAKSTEWCTNVQYISVKVFVYNT